MKYKVTLNGRTYEVEVEETEAVITNVAQEVRQAPAAAPAPPQVQAAAVPVAAQPEAEGEKVLAPMPGIILSLNVVTGQVVKAGDTLLVLEAMKMENEIVASSDGTVKQLLVQKGSTVDTDAVLVIIG